MGRKGLNNLDNTGSSSGGSSGGGKWIEGDNKIIYYNEGDVGIGVTDPYGKLHIQGGSLYIYNNKLNEGQSDAGNANIYLDCNNLKGTDKNGIIWRPYYRGYSKSSAQILFVPEDNDGYFNGGLAFYTSNKKDATTTGNSIERMRIDMSGNVGIGTNYSTTKLDVVGNARFRNEIYISDNSANNTCISVNNIKSITTSNQLFEYNNYYKVSFGDLPEFYINNVTFNKPLTANMINNIVSYDKDKNIGFVIPNTENNSLPDNPLYEFDYSNNKLNLSSISPLVEINDGRGGPSGVPINGKIISLIITDSKILLLTDEKTQKRQ